MNRVPDVEKWNKDLLSSVTVTPWSLHAPKEPEVIFRDQIPIENDKFDDKVVVSRQVYLRNYVFDAFGTTRRCPKCDWFRRTQSWQGQGRPHSNACRARIMGG